MKLRLDHILKTFIEAIIKFSRGKFNKIVFSLINIWVFPSVQIRSQKLHWDQIVKELLENSVYARQNN